MMKNRSFKVRLCTGLAALGIFAGTFGSTAITSFAAPAVMSDGGVFDADYYAKQNPDVVKVLGNDPGLLYQHYLKYGKTEGRKPYDPAADVSALKAGNTTTAAASTASSTAQTANQTTSLPDGDYIAMFVPQDVAGYTANEGRALNLAATGSALIYSGSLSLTNATSEQTPAGTYTIPTDGNTKYYEATSEDGSATQEMDANTFNAKILECAEEARNGGEAKAWSVRIVIQNGVLVSATLRR